MIRRILVPLELSEGTVAATSRSLEIASKLKASVTGLTVVDTEGIDEAVALPFHAEFLDYPRPAAIEMANDAAEKLEGARERFLKSSRERGVASEVRRLRGGPAFGILDMARFYDLLVMGTKSNFHFETETAAGDTLAEVLDLTPVPTFVVSESEATPLGRALVAFDGSPAATRALHAFAEIWPIYRPEVRIVASHREEKVGGHLLDMAQKFLESHGAENITTELLTNESLRESLEDRHLEWADLIVAGVRSKNRLKKFFVGSFARFLIDNSGRTLLLCQ